MKNTSNLRLSPLKKKVFLILIIGIAISVVVFLPKILELFEEPYFIIIKNNDDLEFWSSSGNGTIENPYIIEGHHITVPRNDPDEYDVPCIPESSVISIRDVTKSFIIQNNILEVKGGCEGQYIIRISDISVPFAIRNNHLRSDGYAGSFRLINIDGLNSVISNNILYYAGSHISNSHNINFTCNQFLYSYSHSAYHSSNISYIQNHFYRTSIGIRECSHMLLHDNIFQNNEMYSRSGSLAIIWETDYCTITNNTFIYTGLDLRDSIYSTLFLSGNIVNGKPYGYFYNQSNVIIDSTTKYGQIKLVMCNVSTITDQVISKTSHPLLIENSAHTTIANSTISYCSFSGIKIKFSTNTSILDCVLEVNDIGVLGENSYNIFVKRNLFRRLIFGIQLWDCSMLIEEDNVFEDVDFDVRNW